MAVTLTFGLFRMNGEASFFAVATGMIAGSAVCATGLVWRQDRSSLPAPKEPVFIDREI